MAFSRSPGSPSAAHVLFALFLVYITWGSSYIGYKLSIEVAGPFLVAAGRCGTGGVLLCLLLMLTGRWTRASCATNAWIGVLGIPMVLVASGFVGLGLEQVSSAVGAVLNGSTPIIMIIAGFLFAHEPRPAPRQCVGLVTGSCAIAWLGIMQEGASGDHPIIGAGIILLAVCGWVVGSLLMRHRPIREDISPLQVSAIMLTLGGLECLVLGLLLGEHHDLRWENLRPGIVFAFSWMTIGGSLVAYSVYMWLLANVPLSVAISYEYVVPVVGIFLGWFVAGEPVGLGTLVASAVTVGSVALIIVPGRQGARGNHRGVYAHWRLAWKMHDRLARERRERRRRDQGGA